MCVHGVEWGVVCYPKCVDVRGQLHGFGSLLLSLCESQGGSVCWGTCCISWSPVLCSKCLNTLSHFHGHNSVIFILKDMPILSVIFMNWISFLFHVTIPIGGRNLISTNVVSSLTIQPPTTPALYTGPHLRIAFVLPELMGVYSTPCYSKGLPGFPYSHLSPLCSLRQPCFPQPPCHYLNNSHFKGKQQFSWALVNYPRFSSCWAKKFMNALSKCLWHFATLRPSFF